MNNSRQPLISASETDVGDRTRKKTDVEILRKNPKVDRHSGIVPTKHEQGQPRGVVPTKSSTSRVIPVLHQS